MRGARIGESLFACVRVTRGVPVRHFPHFGGFGVVLEANPDCCAGGGDSIRYVCVVRVGEIIEWFEAVLCPAADKIPDELPEAISASGSEEIKVLAWTESQGNLVELKCGRRDGF